MSDDTSQSSEGESRTAARQRQFGRLRRLVLKELREILRDRRTIITLVVMPLLIYPLLAVVFQRFLLTSISVPQETEYVIAVDSVEGQDLLLKELAQGQATLAKESRGDVLGNAGPRDDGKNGRSEGNRDAIKPEGVNIVASPDSNIERFVADSSVHLGAVFRRERTDKDKDGLQTPFVWELMYRVGSPTSEAALHFVESRLQAVNHAGLNQQLTKLGVAASLPAATERHPIGYSGVPTFSLAALIPLILVLMTVTGAVYPAIDLTAGERERGTLETLIAAPVPRVGLLLAKYVAVLTVALLTAVVNLIGMTITAHSADLAATLLGGGLSIGMALKVLPLLALFAAFFSAILLAVTSFARSFKEAQAYIIPLMLLCLVPGVLCLMPGLEFSGWMAVTPLVNIVMLARDLLEGSVHTPLAVVAVCSTIFYIAAAIGLAARIFGTDAILYGSQATWSDLMQRPKEPQSAASLAAAMFCLALMFPSFFVLASSVGRSGGVSIDGQLVVRALITAAVFGGIPITIAAFGNVRWSTGLGLRKAGLVTFLGAAILGACLWPAAHEVTLLTEKLGLFTLTPELLEKIQDIIKKFQAAPVWLLLGSFAVVPAIFEELCFRGFIFGALRTRLTGTWTVIVTALLFGLFHEFFIPGKLIPSALLGLVLGWVRLRSGSALPGMVLHALHNGVVLSVLYYRDELLARGIGVQEQAHMPISWHAAALLGIAVGAALIVTATRGNESHFSESSSNGPAANRY